jgi:hypothetical protein
VLFPKRQKTLIEIERENRGVDSIEVLKETKGSTKKIKVTRKSQPYSQNKIKKTLDRLKGKKEKFIVRENVSKPRRFL